MREDRLKRTGVVLLALTLLICAGCGTSGGAALRPSPSAAPSPLAARADSYLRQMQAQQRFSGAALLVRDGTVILSKGYGLADWGAGAANTPQTVFRIGSLTKQFTATAILLLQARGKLSVRDPICRYLPTCPAAWRPITLAEALTHTSGIPNLADAQIADYTKPLTSRALLALIQSNPLAFPPGAGYAYSSAGYNALGVVVEEVSGQSYADFLHKNIFTSLGMTSTGYDVNHPTPPGHATGYTSWQAPAPYLDMSLPFAAGALAATVEDLARWDQELDHPAVLPAGVAGEQLTQHVALCPKAGAPCSPPFTALGYGYGWVVGTDAAGRVEYHIGDVLGFRALIARYPDKHASIILLSNVEATDTDALRAGLEAILFGPHP